MTAIERHCISDNLTVYTAGLPDNLSRREAERQTVEAMVEEAFGGDARLEHHPSGAPYVPDCGCEISISHSRHFACLAVSRHAAVGVDIEQPRVQLRRVAPRVLSDAELKYYGVSDRLLLRAWTLKEALYKAAGREGVDFSRDIVLPLADEGCLASVLDREFDIVLIDETPLRTMSVVVENSSQK